MIVEMVGYRLRLRMEYYLKAFLRMVFKQSTLRKVRLQFSQNETSTVNKVYMFHSHVPYTGCQLLKQSKQDGKLNCVLMESLTLQREEGNHPLVL